MIQQNEKIFEANPQTNETYAVPFSEYLEFKNQRYEKQQSMVAESFRKLLDFVNAYRRGKRIGAAKPDSTSCKVRIEAMKQTLDQLLGEAEEINAMNRKMAETAEAQQTVE